VELRSREGGGRSAPDRGRHGGGRCNDRYRLTGRGGGRGRGCWGRLVNRRAPYVRRGQAAPPVEVGRAGVRNEVGRRLNTEGRRREYIAGMGYSLYSHSPFMLLPLLRRGA